MRRRELEVCFAEKATQMSPLVPTPMLGSTASTKPKLTPAPQPPIAGAFQPVAPGMSAQKQSVVIASKCVAVFVGRHSAPAGQFGVQRAHADTGPDVIGLE